MIQGNITYNGVTANNAIFVIQRYCGSEENDIIVYVLVYATQQMLDEGKYAHSFNATIPYSNTANFSAYLNQALADAYGLTIV